MMDYDDWFRGVPYKTEDVESIPDHVQMVLDEWESLAFYAYDNYERYGRIVVGIEENPEVPSGIQLVSIIYDDEEGEPDDVTARLLATYDPAYEIPIQFVDEAGRLRTQRLRSVPDGQHPRKVYFFEVLGRVNDDPKILYEEDFPAWFVEAVERLARGLKEE